MTTRYTLHQGDCLEVLRTMPDASIDAVVTDPPYGLSQAPKGDVRSLGRTLLDVVLPDLANLYAERLSDSELPFPRGSVPFLDWALRSIWKEAGVGVPERPIDLQGDVKLREKEVKAAGIGSISVPDGKLVDENNAPPFKDFGDYVLNFRPLRHSSFRDCDRIGLRELGFGRFSVPVIIPSDSCFARLLRSKHATHSTTLGEFIGLGDRAPAEAEVFPCVVASSAAELVAVLSFDVAGGTCEILPARATGKLDLIAELVSSESVAAFTTAGRLPPVLKPHGMSLVGDSADGAFTINFHKDLLGCLNSSRSGFMGKEWDRSVPTEEVWRECLRVLKPGGHLLAFAGTRTQHRMAVRIEDAGFEIRDMIAWVYGSGFPKSHDVSKAIDKIYGQTGTEGPMKRGGERLLSLKDGKRDGLGRWGNESGRNAYTTIPATGDAKRWEGWGTALKPALEPITVARKPFKGTVAANVLEHGTGVMNIDGCRVGDEKGRWPANFAHDGSDEVLALFPETAVGGGVRRPNGSGRKNTYAGGWGPDEKYEMPASTGSAARYFYCAKASKKDRGEGNNHPTVKPTDLMKYLCRLVTPPGGVVLDPFMGSGSTGKAAILEGFSFIGVDLDPDYVEIARARIEAAQPEALLFTNETK